MEAGAQQPPIRRPLRARASRRRLGAGCAVVALLAQGCTLLSFDKRSAYKFDHPPAVEDGAFRRSLDAFGTPMVGGNRAEILNNGDEIFPGMMGAIRDAKVTVNLESYIFKNDEAGKMFAESLMDAARRGVEVRVLVDATGSSRTGPLLDKMRQAGVKADVFHPIRLWSLYKIGRRSHRKILVVDGTISFTGGFCIANSWLGNARNP
ncbi:MAG TPA: phospholipase D-like domain-containing protein, partial [Thermoanaerobaculia bacterium]|nr:phospholipase D-like domain-containing protein [Thermoanaerobaculia bacterium]